MEYVPQLSAEGPYVDLAYNLHCSSRRRHGIIVPIARTGWPEAPTWDDLVIEDPPLRTGWPEDTQNWLYSIRTGWPRDVMVTWQVLFDKIKFSPPAGVDVEGSFDDFEITEESKEIVRRSIKSRIPLPAGTVRADYFAPMKPGVAQGQPWKVPGG